MCAGIGANESVWLQLCYVFPCFCMSHTYTDTLSPHVYVCIENLRAKTKVGKFQNDQIKFDCNVSGTDIFCFDQFCRDFALKQKILRDYDLELMAKNCEN